LRVLEIPQLEEVSVSSVIMHLFLWSWRRLRPIVWAKSWLSQSYQGHQEYPSQAEDFFH